MTLYARFSEALEEKKQQHLLRQLTLKEKKVLFSSNDYLGLSKHPFILNAAQNALNTWGFGSGSARTFLSHQPLYHELEILLAKTLNKDKALLFSSGFQLNSTFLKALSNKNTLFFLDKYCHRSLLEGALNSEGKVFRYKHNDLNHLESLLKKHRKEGKEAWIVSESLFSMHGTRPDLASLIELKKQYGTYLIVDEAHTLGVIDFPRDGIDLSVGGFGKALGGFGGFVAGDRTLIDYLVNFCPGFLFTTALPPLIVAGLIEGLKLLPTLTKEREQLFKNCALLRKLLHLPPGDYIVPFPLESAEKAQSLANALQAKGFDVPAVRPPTVPPNGSILRFSLTASHTEEEIEKVANVVKELV